MKNTKVWNEIKVDIKTKGIHECLKLCRVHKYPVRKRHLHDFSGGDVYDVLCSEKDWVELSKEFLKK